MKSFSQILAKMILIVLLATFLYLPTSIKIVQAADSAVCEWVNAQNGTGEAIQYDGAPPTGDPQSQAYKDAQNKRISDYMAKVVPVDTSKLDQKYANKLIVITEEPLGNPLADFSSTCARQTKCSQGMFDSNNPKPIRKCFTKYTTPDNCKSTVAPTTLDLHDQTKPLEYCEIVQVYFSDGGPSLLYGYIGAIYRYMAVLGGFIAVLALIIAGVMRSTSGDQPEMVTKANQLVTRVISGLIVLFLSAVILYTINPNFFVIS